MIHKENLCNANESQFNVNEVCNAPQDVFCKYGDAVVSIRSEFIMVNGTTITTAAAVATQQLVNGTRQDVVLSTSGFFIKEHFIIAPAQGILMPPTYNSAASRYPFTTVPPRTVGAAGVIYNSMIRPSRILVNVRNVNGNGKDYVYQATLIGVDGAGDVAVLKICNSRTGWNYKVPCIKNCHPYFSWGKSCDVCVGDKALVIGNIQYPNGGTHPELHADYQLQIVETNVSNNQYVAEDGFALQELITVGGLLVNLLPGAPILNSNGRIIGMYTNSTNFNGGPTEKFIARSAKTILRGRKNHKAKDFLQCVPDPIAKYLRVLKSYIGISYQTFDGVEYDITETYDPAEQAFAGRPRVRLNAAGAFLDTPICKRVNGIRVTGIAGLDGTYFVPASSIGALFPNGTDPGGYTGLTGGYEVYPNSAWVASLQPGDLIIKIGKCKLDTGFAPAKITWKTKPGRTVTIKYVRGGNRDNVAGTNDAVGNYDADPVKIDGVLGTYPAGLDYPWYAVNIFPNLIAAGFAAPAAQSGTRYPEYAVASLHGVFRPSI